MGSEGYDAVIDTVVKEIKKLQPNMEKKEVIEAAKLVCAKFILFWMSFYKHMHISIVLYMYLYILLLRLFMLVLELKVLVMHLM